MGPVVQYIVIMLIQLNLKVQQSIYILHAINLEQLLKILIKDIVVTKYLHHQKMVIGYLEQRIYKDVIQYLVGIKYFCMVAQ